MRFVATRKHRHAPRGKREQIMHKLTSQSFCASPHRTIPNHPSSNQPTKHPNGIRVQVDSTPPESSYPPSTAILNLDSPLVSSPPASDLVPRPTQLGNVSSRLVLHTLPSPLLPVPSGSSIPQWPRRFSCRVISACRTDEEYSAQTSSSSPSPLIRTLHAAPAAPGTSLSRSHPGTLSTCQGLAYLPRRQ